MEVQAEDPAREVKRLQRCINDLVSLLALPAIWSGGDPSQVVDTLLDALMRMLSLDLVCVRLTDPVGGAPVEIVRIAQSRGPMPPPHEVFESLSHSVEDNSRKWPPFLRSLMGEGDISIVPLPLGLEGEFGVILAAAQRADFPQQTEALLLSVAANQAAIGLQEARLRTRQKRISDELDQRVEQRTAELGVANAELQLQVGLLQDLPVSAWTLKPDGTPDFVNRVWLEFSGQTLDFVRSHPEAWMTAVHPDDREAASKVFWEGVRSGEGFAFETRSRRAQDGTYRWHLQQAVALRDAAGKVLKFVGTTTDIDNQKRAEEKLRASENDLRKIIDSIPGLVFVMSPAGLVEFPNQRLLDYFGKTLDEINAWATNDAVHPGDLPRVIAASTRSMTTGTPFDEELRYRRADGVYRWFHGRSHPVRDADGRITRWYALVTDIDDRKNAEEALRESEHESRLIVDSIPGQIAVLSAGGELEFLSRPLLDYYGKTLEELKLWTTSDVVFHEDLPRLIDAMTHSLTSGEPLEVEARSRRFDGVYRWFRLRGHPLRDRQGRIVRWYILQTDIDDKKRAQDALKKSEQNLSLIIDTMPALAWSARPDGSAEFLGQRWLNYTGMPAAEAQGWGWAKAFHPDDIDRVIVYWRSILVSGEPGEIEARLRQFDGAYRWFLIRANPLRDESGAILKWYGTNTDIDDRKQAEEELRNAQSELARVMRVMTMGQLTASIAHEVNQPLSGIITNASTCLRMLDANPPNLEGARETARRTIRDGHRASDVITRLRTLYSKKEPAVEPMDLNEVAHEVTALSATEIQRNGVTLRQEFADELPPALGDRIQLQQVILNLLRNAVDAMSEIDDRPRELVVRTERDDGSRIRLSVKDSGVGLTPQAADKIFEAFYTTKTDGMGIGLSISRSIIEAHQGRLWATRNDGPGSTFSFSIPCRREGLADAEIHVNQADPSTDAA